MGAGDPCRNHGQGAIALTLVLEPVLDHEDSMGMPTPLPHQPRARLQHDTKIEG